MKFYAVLYDRQPNIDYTQFHDSLVAHPRIRKWWHYLKSSYIIGTDISASELSTYVRECFDNASISNTHLVVKIDIRRRQGMLSKKAWEWFKNWGQNQDALD